MFGHRSRFPVSGLFTALALLSAQASAADVCSARSGAQAVPLVELYTSEGCSSCPPADRWLTQQLQNKTPQANWLAFHVDYWDELGWQDRFASPSYSARQRERVNAVGESTVYTPQVMIGANVQTRWHSSSGFADALATARSPAQAALALNMQRNGKDTQLSLGAVRVGQNTAPAQVWLAQSVDGQQTSVRAGENNGVLLRHDRVVRKLWGPWRLGDNPLAQRVTLPADVTGTDFTAFVQDARGNTLQSLRLAGAECR